MHRAITRRQAGAIAVGGASAVLSTVRPAYAYNCVDVVLRDPFWGQFRRIIETGWEAAGIAPALGRTGFPVDGTPSVGAIMSWPAGMYGASGVGHVGVVHAINEDGSVVVRHENWPYGSPEHLQTFTVRPGMKFVHMPEPVQAPAGPEPPGIEVVRTVDTLSE